MPPSSTPLVPTPAEGLPPLAPGFMGNASVAHDGRFEVISRSIPPHSSEKGPIDPSTPSPLLRAADVDAEFGRWGRLISAPKTSGAGRSMAAGANAEVRIWMKVGKSQPKMVYGEMSGFESTMILALKVGDLPVVHELIVKVNLANPCNS